MIRTSTTTLLLICYLATGFAAGSQSIDTSGPVAKVLPDTSNLKLDLIKVPTSAAFSLLGISSSLIEDPKSSSDFVLSLNNATQDFTRIPRSYGVEFSPAWIFQKDKIDFSKTVSNKLGDNLRQSLLLSFAVNPVDDPMLTPGNMAITELGLGVKASLVRGKADNTFSTIESMYNVLDSVNNAYFELVNKSLDQDTVYKSLSDRLDTVRARLPNDPSLTGEVQRLVEALDQRSGEISEDINQSLLQANEFQNQLTRLKAIGSNIKYSRHGFKLDFASGLVTDFRNSSFDSTRVTKIGAWLTGGWTINNVTNTNTTTILGVLRLLGNPDQLYKSGNSLLTDNNLFFDYGGKVSFHNGDKLNISGEIIGRIPINNDLLKSTSRYTLNFAYQVSNALVLTLNLGKDFNGVFSDSGNLLTALQLFSYFGGRSYDNNGNPTR